MDLLEGILIGTLTTALGAAFWGLLLMVTLGLLVSIGVAAPTWGFLACWIIGLPTQIVLETIAGGDS